jgi:hypothetical protein
MVGPGPCTAPCVPERGSCGFGRRATLSHTLPRGPAGRRARGRPQTPRRRPARAPPHAPRPLPPPHPAGWTDLPGVKMARVLGGSARVATVKAATLEFVLVGGGRGGCVWGGRVLVRKRGAPAAPPRPARLGAAAPCIRPAGVCGDACENPPHTSARARAHHTHTPTHTTHARTHARTRARTHARAHTRTHARTHACTHARTRAHTHTHAHAHAHTHTTRTHATPPPADQRPGRV